MDGIDSVEHGNLQPCARGCRLDLRDDLVPLLRRQRLVFHVQDGANAVLLDCLLKFLRRNLQVLVDAVGNHSDFQLRHLPDLFLQRHLTQQAVDFFFVRWRGWMRDRGGKELRAVAHLVDGGTVSRIMTSGCAAEPAQGQKKKQDKPKPSTIAHQVCLVARSPSRNHQMWPA